MKELQEALKKEAEEIRQRDREMAAQGCYWRVTYWDHNTGGDDVQIDAYFSKSPRDLTKSDGEAYTVWQKIKQDSLDDYEIIDLCHKCGGSTWLENKADGTRFCKECGAVRGDKDE